MGAFFRAARLLPSSCLFFLVIVVVVVVVVVVPLAPANLPPSVLSFLFPSLRGRTVTLSPHLPTCLLHPILPLSIFHFPFSIFHLHLHSSRPRPILSKSPLLHSSNDIHVPKRCKYSVHHSNPSCCGDSAVLAVSVGLNWILMRGLVGDGIRVGVGD